MSSQYILKRCQCTISSNRFKSDKQIHDAKQGRICILCDNTGYVLPLHQCQLPLTKTYRRSTTKMNGPTVEELQGTIKAMLAQKRDPTTQIQITHFGFEDWSSSSPAHELTFAEALEHKYRVYEPPAPKLRPWGRKEWEQFDGKVRGNQSGNAFKVGDVTESTVEIGMSPTPFKVVFDGYTHLNGRPLDVLVGLKNEAKIINLNDRHDCLSCFIDG